MAVFFGTIESMQKRHPGLSKAIGVADFLLLALDNLNIFWKYWKYQYQYPILSFSSEALILQCFLVDFHFFINLQVPLGCKTEIKKNHKMALQNFNQGWVATWYFPT